MKKTIFTLICLTILLLSSCIGGSTIEGTWYSLPETNMLQFENGKVTMAGQNVGQYENAGDYIILSMVDGTTNQILYLTMSNGVEVLADSKHGNGTIYLCRGFEEAKQMIANLEPPKTDTEINKDNTIDGTWYSLPEINMLQFENGKVTMAGQNVGQYDNTDDYIILSMTDGTSNQVLYLTNLHGTDVLADTKQGEGTIYFCRSFEETKQIVADMEQKKQEINDQKVAELIKKYTVFLDENLIGTWETNKPVTLFGPAAKIIEFTSDQKIKMTMTDYSIVELEWIDMTVHFENDRLIATLTTEEEELLLLCTNDTFTTYEFYMNGSIFTKVQH